MVDHRQSHVNVLSAGDGQQCLGRAGGDAGDLVTEIARYLVGEQHRGTVCMQYERIVRTGFDAIAALGAALEKQRFINRPGRAQPVSPNGGSGFLGRRIRMGGIFFRRLRDGEDGILEKIPPPVFGISRHG